MSDHEPVLWDSPPALFPEPTQQRSCYFVSSEQHKGFGSPVLTGTYFTVKSADSGIPNSADGSREVLTDVASDNNLPAAGRKAPGVPTSRGRSRTCIFLPDSIFLVQKLTSLHPWPCLLRCLLPHPARRGSSMSPKSTARVCSSTGPRLLAACPTWLKRWLTEQRSTGSTRRRTRGRRSWWRCKGWARMLVVKASRWTQLSFSVVMSDMYALF